MASPLLSTPHHVAFIDDPRVFEGHDGADPISDLIGISSGVGSKLGRK
jgi:hypothetical protein